MKKRILATLTVFCLLVGLLPAGAFAAGYVYSGTQDQKIVFSGGETTATLRDLRIIEPGTASDFTSAIDICDGADVTLILEGKNVLQGDTNRPAIWVQAGSSLTIEGSGSLEVSGYATPSNGAAGIGGGYNEAGFGDIIINSGTIIARGVGGGAGIGGGYKVGGGTQTGNITINGGFVRAFGGNFGASTGAGLGSGENADFTGKITINGGVVYAEGGDSDTVSIGAGGRGIGNPSDHGTFSTGVNGNAVIVAPNGIGANQGFADWDAIFCSYNSDKTTAEVTSDGTVVLNDSDATIEVWGGPVLDYGLTIDSGTTLSIKADSQTKKPVSLTMNGSSTLTNNGTIELGNGNDASYLALMGGVRKTAGSGELKVADHAAVWLPLTGDLVTLAPESSQYTGKEQSPNVTVKLKNLWEYSQEFKEGIDYTQTVLGAPVKDVKSYPIALSATDFGNLLWGSANCTYQIVPADLNVTMPDSWTVWKGSLPGGLPVQPSSLSSPGMSEADIQSEIGTSGTITWYVDESCTVPLTKQNIPQESTATVYWKYTHTSQNFTKGQTGSMKLHISDTEPPVVTFKDFGNATTKTYGAHPFYLNAQIKQGETEVPIQSDVTWNSSDTEVATVSPTSTDGTAQVTITGRGQATITANIAAYNGESGTAYPPVTGTFTLTVTPKTIQIDESNLTLNNTSAGANGVYTWPYDGKTEVEVYRQSFNNNELVAGDEQKIFLNGSAVLDSADAGNRTATVTYTLTGNRAMHYTLSPESSTKTVNITKAEKPTIPDASGRLTITNNLAKTYLFNLEQLDLSLPTGQILGGSVSYAVGSSIDFTGGQPAYENHITAAILDGTNLMKVRVDAVNGAPGEVCKIPVTVSSSNFAAFPAYITLVAENREAGHAAGDITVTNQVTGTGANADDEFTYTLELKRSNSDLVEIFTAPVAYRGTGAVTGGTAGIVTPDAEGVISFTLKGGQELVFSGNLDQDRKIEYTVTQTGNNGYTTTVTHQTHEDPTSTTTVPDPVTGQLTCADEGDNSGHSTDWAVVRYTNAKDAGTGGSGTDWEDNDYTLYYHSNFGTDKRFYQTQSSSAMKVRDYGDMKQLPARDGYEFVCWNTEKDGSGKDYAPGDIYRVSGSSAHLYAQWAKTGLTPDDTGVSRWLNTADHFAYLRGYGTGAFGPSDNMTRAEVAQMFYNLLLDRKVPVTVSFTDVPADAWYADAVNALASLGVLKGVGGGEFAPQRTITRAEFTVIAMRFARSDGGGKDLFSDVGPDDWFYDQVTGAAHYGWITGYSDGTFRPLDRITRAEVTIITNRMLGRSADRDYVDRHRDSLRRFPDVADTDWAYYQIMEATNGHTFTASGDGERWTGLAD